MKFNLLTVAFCFFLLCCSSNEKTGSRPTAQAKLFGQQVPDHPRLLFSKEEEKNIKALSKSDPLLNNLIEVLRKVADELLHAPALDAPNNLGKSREHLYRVITLATAYRMLDDEKYAHAAKETLINISRFPSWNPDHYLDVAETTTAVAIGYDWLYDFLDDDTKKKLENAITEKALNLAIPEYEKTGNPGSWAKRETNWNVVCNTGMALGALAIAEKNPGLTEKIIEYAAEFVPNCLKHYSPDGVCYEGPAYWNYTNNYLSMLLKALDDNIEDDFGISSLPGVSNTAKFYVQSLSPTNRVFNFANSSANADSSTSPIFFYFGEKFNQPSVIHYYKNRLAEIVEGKIQVPKWNFFLSVAWYPDRINPEPSRFPPLQVFENEFNPMLVFNGDREKEGSVFLTAKGGDPDEAHQQLDVGTFLIESDGVRWADDPGSDSYSLPGFWDYKPGGMRWNYFRNTNFSHNTLSIDNQLQYSAGNGTLSKYRTDTDKPFGIIEMSTMYKGQAESVSRGFMMLDDKVMLIQDEVVPLSSNQSVCWSMITEADIQIERNRAILTSGEKSFYISVISPAEVTITSEIAKNFSDEENPISGYRLLKVTMNPGELADTPLQILAGSDQDVITGLSSSSYPELSAWK